MINELGLTQHIDKLSIDMGQSSPTGYKTTMSIWAMDCKEWHEYFIKAQNFGTTITRTALKSVTSYLMFSPIGFLESKMDELSDKGKEIKIKVTDNWADYELGETAIVDMIDQDVMTYQDGNILHDLSHIISLYVTSLLEIIEGELTEGE